MDTRRDASGAEAAKALKRADAVFFTAATSCASPASWAGPGRTRRCSKPTAGRAGRGHQPGASALRSTMIVDGLDNEQARSAPSRWRRGWASGAGADRPALRAARPVGRLVTGVAENPHALGVGIDEDTAIRIDPDACFFDWARRGHGHRRREHRESNVSELAPDEILAIQGATLHVLPRGYGFDMKTRQVLPPAGNP